METTWLKVSTVSRGGGKTLATSSRVAKLPCRINKNPSAGVHAYPLRSGKKKGKKKKKFNFSGRKEPANISPVFTETGEIKKRAKAAANGKS